MAAQYKKISEQYVLPSVQNSFPGTSIYFSTRLCKTKFCTHGKGKVEEEEGTGKGMNNVSRILKRKREKQPEVFVGEWDNIITEMPDLMLTLRGASDRPEMQNFVYEQIK